MIPTLFVSLLPYEINLTVIPQFLSWIYRNIHADLEDVFIRGVQA
jgi:hypothetical protein